MSDNNQQKPPESQTHVHIAKQLIDFEHFKVQKSFPYTLPNRVKCMLSEKIFSDTDFVDFESPKNHFTKR
jgi:hypothetical protein